MAAIRLRFVTGASLVSAAIRAHEDFWASHVEAVMPDGKLLGAHVDGGVLARPAGYDAGQWTKQLILELPCEQDTADAFHDYLRGRLGEPYDMAAICGFVLHADMHAAGHGICSALQTLALRACRYFFAPLVEPAHKVSPRDLLLILSARVPVLHDPESPPSLT
jgi:hypothetical protein